MNFYKHLSSGGVGKMDTLPLVPPPLVIASNTSSLKQHEQHLCIYNMGSKNNVPNLTLERLRRKHWTAVPTTQPGKFYAPACYST